MTRPGCHNKPRPTPETTHIAQDGWREYTERGIPVRVPVLVEVKHRMSTECMYDVRTTNPGCAGCHQAATDEGKE